MRTSRGARRYPRHAYFEIEGGTTVLSNYLDRVGSSQEMTVAGHVRKEAGRKIFKITALRERHGTVRHPPVYPSPHRGHRTILGLDAEQYARGLQANLFGC